MKRFSISILAILWIIISIGCGKNLHYKEGAPAETIKTFLQAIQEGKLDKANTYLLDAKTIKDVNIKNDTVVKNFLNLKIESFEIGSELPAIRDAIKLKQKLAGKTLDEKKTYDILESIQKDLGRMVKEKCFIVKVKENGTEKSYFIYYFMAQNLNHITGIVEIAEEQLKTTVAGMTAISLDTTEFLEKVYDIIVEKM